MSSAEAIATAPPLTACQNRSAGDACVPYMRQLDGLRAMAVLSVTWFHFAPESWQLGVRWGKLGVWLFFVLSGFLITGILLRTRVWVEESSQGLGYSVRQFFARRFLRIFPLYYAVIALGLWLGFRGVRETVLWQLTYTVNFLIGMRGWHQPGHFWSLGVEEQFYLFWPWFVFLAPRTVLKRILVGAMVLAPCLRLALAWAAAAGLVNEYAATYLTPCCFDGLGAGALLALVADDPNLGRDRADRLTRTWLVAGALGLCVVQAAIWRWGDSLVLECLQYIPASMAFGYLVWRASLGFGGPVGSLLSWAPMVLVGQISYCVYVIHPFVKEAFDRVVGPLGLGLTRPGWINLLLLHLATFGLAYLSWRLFESPINGLKRYFPYHRSG